MYSVSSLEASDAMDSLATPSWGVSPFLGERPSLFICATANLAAARLSAFDSKAMVVRRKSWSETVSTTRG